MHPDMPAGHASPQVVIIGLDVGDGHLIREWSQQGLLPSLHALITNGTWQWLNTTAGTLHVSAWPSLYTGTMPGKHGVYYTFQPAPGQQGARRFGADQYGCPPFWQLLSDAGKHCIVLDAPYTHPHHNFKGLQIFEWGTWAWYWEPMSTPPETMRHLKRHCGAYPLGFEANQVGMGPLDLTDLHRRLLQAAASKATSARWLMAQASWDVFVVVFGETHAAAHYGWPPAAVETASDAPTSGLLQDVYQAVDQAIGKILANVGADTTVFVVSGDGVGPNHAGWHLLPEVLQRLGFTMTPDHASAEGTPSAQPSRQQTDRLKKLRDLVPMGLRQSVSRRLPTRWRDALMSRWATANIDWPHTRAFCLPTDLEGYIRVNVKGREPAGIVRQGAEYDRVCDQIIAALEQLINPATGRPAVRQIVRTDVAFPGKRRDYLPDLIVLWADEAAVQEVYSPEVGMVRSPSPDARPGTHRAPGFVLAHGPHIQRGQVQTGGHIVDFAPTILAHFNLPSPSYMDGCTWDSLRAGDTCG